MDNNAVVEALEALHSEGGRTIAAQSEEERHQKFRVAMEEHYKKLGGIITTLKQSLAQPAQAAIPAGWKLVDPRPTILQLEKLTELHGTLNVRLTEAGDAEVRDLSSQPSAPVVPEGYVKLSRDFLGQAVRDAWMRWAMLQPTQKPSWLVPYAELSEADKEADRMIGEAIELYVVANVGTKFAPTEPQRDERALFEKAFADTPHHQMYKEPCWDFWQACAASRSK